MVEEIFTISNVGGRAPSEWRALKAYGSNFARLLLSDCFSCGDRALSKSQFGGEGSRSTQTAGGGERRNKAAAVFCQKLGLARATSSGAPETVVNRTGPDGLRIVTNPTPMGYDLATVWVSRVGTMNWNRSSPPLNLNKKQPIFFEPR